MLEVSKYIHNNPVKAQITKQPSEYEWSSFNEYIGKRGNLCFLTDVDMVLGIISKDKSKARKEYIKYVLQQSENMTQVMDVEDDYYNTHEAVKPIGTKKQAVEMINRVIGEMRVSFVELLDNNILRDKLIRDIRKNSTLSLREIGELFGGVSESRVCRILQKE